ncbi:MAG: hypothetical protein ACR2M1_00945 [Gemmatimonadaceae bacterium]
MTNIFRPLYGVRGATLLVGATALILAGCKVGDVTNPGLLDASKFNPSNDGAALSLSAQTQFYKAFQTIAYNGSFFGEEQLSGAARTEIADIGRRNFTASDPDINTTMYAPLSQAIVGNINALNSLKGGPNAASDVNIARASKNLGFSLVLMAETFCNGTIQGGPALTSAQILDSAIVRFNQAIAIASAASGTEAIKILHSSRIGLARAYLQKGDNANAAATAAQVLSTAPATFKDTVPTVDDPSNRPLGNLLYSNASVSRLATVPASYQALNDPRVPFLDTKKLSQDNILPAIIQQKYTSYGSSLRVSSYLEAQYIQAEANLKANAPGAQAAALALINTRRTAGRQNPFVSADGAAILSELLNQRARDFWLEAKKVGDWRRNGAAEPFISPAGAPYKGTLTFGSVTCVPIPQEEIDANPNLH